MSASSDSPSTVVITGISRGLGRAMAQGFVERGWRVAGFARSAAEVESLAEELGESHLVRVGDVLDEGSIASFRDEVLEALGSPDLLINNAALMNGSAPLWEVPADDFDRVIDVNLKGIANVIRAFVPAMIERGRGIIVNFSSGWGRSTSPEVAPYCATKWGVEGLSQAMAQELPPGLASIALSPGVIDTDMLRSCWGEEAASFPGPDAWRESALNCLEKLNAGDNGKSLTV